MGKLTSGFMKKLNEITSFGNRLPENIVRFVRFSFSSSSTLVLDLFLLAIFVEFFEVNPVFAAGISFTISNSANYVINRFWGFRETQRSLARGYLLFVTIGTLGLALTVLLMWLFVDKLGVVYFLSRIIVAIIEGSLSFVLHYFVTFGMHRKVVEYRQRDFVSRFG